MKQLERKTEITYRWWRDDDKDIDPAHIEDLNERAEEIIHDMASDDFTEKEANEHSSQNEIKQSIIGAFESILKRSQAVMTIDLDRIRVHVDVCLGLCRPSEIEDMQAYIGYSTAGKKTVPTIASTLMHDLNGIRDRNGDKNPNFFPRTAGYSDLI
ncbi:hypothetical protein LCGC14_0763560 [marine sediment metagenome]|uniref:Uncharacterized protein n=1 Tax=marine sediment metagenome TaxID=412755 RepID=A0A0F9T7D4_9ZZZZ